jgi:PKD repeat protein
VAGGAANGSVCANGSECSTGFCADGRCCNGACGGECDACAVSAGAAVNGTCGLVGTSVTCRASTSTCDVAEVCSGASAACPADGFAAVTQECRASAGICDVAERCTGSNAICPPDAPAVDGLVCGSGPFCDGARTCQAGVCTTRAACVDPLGEVTYACDEATRSCNPLPAPPTVIREALLTAAVGIFYPYSELGRVRARGAPPMRFARCGGPPELRVEALTGEVSWTPASPGPAVLCVRATNAHGNDEYSFAVEVSASPDGPAPRADFLLDPAIGPAPLTVQLDARASTGDLVAFRWDPGNHGAYPVGSVVTERYPTAGGYAPLLQVIDRFGRTDATARLLVVTRAEARPPSARIFSSARSGVDSLEVAFSCDCQPGAAPIVAYRWELGPRLSSDPAPTERFGPGRYKVQLTVVDAVGLTARDAVEISVLEGTRVPPRCSLGASPPAGLAPLEVEYQSSFADADGEVTEAVLTLADGSRGDVPRHRARIERVGVARATLEVIDDHGLRCADAVEVIAQPANGAVPPKILSVPESEARCSEPWSYQARVAGEGTAQWSLEAAPEGMSLDGDSGALSWTPARGLRGARSATLSVETPSGRDAQQVEINVSCDQRYYLGCGGCSAAGGGAPLLWVAMALWRGRRSRASAEALLS